MKAVLVFLVAVLASPALAGPATCDMPPITSEPVPQTRRAARDFRQLQRALAVIREKCARPGFANLATCVWGTAEPLHYQPSEADCAAGRPVCSPNPLNPVVCHKGDGL